VQSSKGTAGTAQAQQEGKERKGVILAGSVGTLSAGTGIRIQLQLDGLQTASDSTLLLLLLPSQLLYTQVFGWRHHWWMACVGLSLP
jgi:hypothetical protein